MDGSANNVREFGRFRLDAGKKVLWCAEIPVPLALKEIELLCALTERGGDVLTKEELLDRVWHDSFVEESNLSHHIYRIRKAFRESGESGEFIQTVPRRGYRFSMPVSSVGDPPLVIERHLVERTSIEIEEYRSPKTSFLWRFGLPAALALVLVAAAGWRYSTVLGGHTEAPPPSGVASFAGEGKVLTNLGYKNEKALAAASQPDGKIVVAGWVGESQADSDFALVRYNVDGTLDPTFDADGKVVTPLGERTDLAYAVAVQPDGKILAAGVNFNGPKTRRLAVVRYKPDGSLDAGFDGDGIVTVNVGTSQADTAYAIAVQSDGKIVVAGSAWTATGNTHQNDFCVLRLEPDGSLDTGFGQDGKVITDFGFGDDIAYSLTLQPDGKIVLGGVATNGLNQDFALARYSTDGKLDPSFGSGGKIRTDFAEEEDLATSLVLQPDGKIVAAGYASHSFVSDVALTRYTTDGSLDNSFNGNGKLKIDINGNETAKAISLMPDGRILIAAFTGMGNSVTQRRPECALARVMPDGRLDETFYSTGSARVSFNDKCETFSMAGLPGGDVVLAGSTGDDESSHFALLRLAL